MKTLSIPNAPGPVSALCFGTAGFGGERIPEERAFALLDLWRELGGILVDTANVYGRWVDGTNLGERIIGRWLASRGKRALTVATKCCHYDAKAPQVSRVREDCARRDIEESLSALGLDALDVCWLHRDDPAVPVAEIVGFCERLRDEGLIRSYGFSNWTADRLSAAWALCREKGYRGLMGVQNRHAAPVPSEAALAAGDPTLVGFSGAQAAFHRGTGIAELPFSALGQGAFVRMARAGAEARNGRLVSVRDEAALGGDFARTWLSERNLRRYERMADFCAGSGMDMTAACVAFHTSRDYPDIPVAATSEPAHLRRLAAACDETLPAALIAAVEAL
ncbi:MAG: aldo/keto reductase [Oscillospiraceae bacterium]|nr:aldo/keto reductase [Oscillospiraceae bacterium]